jgi:hypothetical protein
MPWLLRWRRRTAGIAIFAILLNALAPAVTHARAALAPADAALAQLCTASGLLSVALPDADAGTATEHGQASAHDDGCPFCGSHAGSFLLLDTRPALAVPVPQRQTHRLLPRLRDLHLAWSAHHPRGPPAA